MILKFHSIICFFMSVITISFCSFFCPYAFSAELDTVKVYYKPIIPWSPIFIAEEDGFFKDQGIQVEFVKARNTAEALILLISGSLDVAMGIPTAGMFNAAGEGKKIEFVAGLTYLQKDNHYAGIAIHEKTDKHPDLQSTVKGLKGKKIGNHIFGSITHFFLESLLDQYDMSKDDIDLMILPFPSMISAINNGTLDAGQFVEPFITILKKNTKISLISYGDVFPNAPLTFLFFGPHSFNGDSDLAIRFLKAYLKGCNQYDMGKTKRNIDIIRKHCHFDQETLLNMDWPKIEPNGIHNLDILEKYQDWLFSKQLLNKKIDIKLMINTDYLSNAS